MSDSAKKTVGALAGGTIGFFLGGGTPAGALKGASIGYSIGSSFTTTELDVAEGPRVDDLGFQNGDYNTIMNRCYGDAQVAGNVIWIEGNEIKEGSHTTTVKQGGKGGGGSSQTTSTYTYSATFAIGISENAIAGVDKIFADNTLI